MKRLQISYLKISDHRNGKRVWLQGLRLEEAGYEIGSMYSRTHDKANRKVTIVKSDCGKNKVSRKKIGDRFYPVIDTVSQDIAEIFSDVDRVQVIVTETCISIELHHLDQKRIEREKRLEDTIRSRRPLPMASMAHGAGILDYYLHKGLEDENIRSGLIWAVEPDNTYLQTSLNNNPIWSYECEVIEGRIEDIDQHQLKSPLVLIAGLPCTGASKSGRSKNKLTFAEQHESAGTAFIGYLMAIGKLSPAICFLENVPEYTSTVSMHMIRETLKDWKYRVHEIIVNRELGAFEDRKRLCMVAVSEGIDFEFDLQPVRQREQTLGEILDDIPADSPLWNPCVYLDEKQVRDKKEGKGFSIQLVDENSLKVGTIGRSYCKWRSTEPLVANHPTDPGLKRLLTVDEVSKVKTIDKMLVEGMSRNKQIEMMGQSVLGVAFRAVGRNLGKCLNRQFCASESIAA